MRSRIMRLFAGIFMIACLCIQNAYGEVFATIAEDEWTWEPDGTATFRGEVRCDQENTDELCLQLTIIPKPEEADPGEVVFTAINDKKLTIRNQKSEYSWIPDGNNSVAFSGSWYFPSENNIREISIRLCVRDKDGTVIAESILQKQKEEETAVQTGRMILPGNPDRIRIILLTAAGIVWCFAIIRIILLGRKRKKE